MVGERTFDFPCVCGRMGCERRIVCRWRQRHPHDAAQAGSRSPSRNCTHGWAAFAAAFHGCIFIPYEVRLPLRQYSLAAISSRYLRSVLPNASGSNAAAVADAARSASCADVDCDS